MYLASFTTIKLGCLTWNIPKLATGYFYLQISMQLYHRCKHEQSFFNYQAQSGFSFPSLVIDIRRTEVDILRRTGWENEHAVLYKKACLYSNCLIFGIGNHSSLVTFIPLCTSNNILCEDSKFVDY